LPVAVVAVILIAVVGAIAYVQFGSSKCSGYPPTGNCIAPYSYTFKVSVNYTGSWRLNYSGQTDVGESNAYNITGTYTGRGNFSVPVTLSGLNSRMLTVCAQAQKLDGSGSPLSLGIDTLFPKNVSTPYGSVSTCGGVAP
jgi:hypothetical protein